MIDVLAVMLGLLAALICIADWRKGIFICILVGFLQDPLRKMIEGGPVFLTVTVAFFLGLTLIGAKMRRRVFSVADHPIWSPAFRRLVYLFIGYVMFQSFVSFWSTGSPVIAGIGILAYFAPIPALLLTYIGVRNETDIVRVLRFYIIIAACVTTGIYLSYIGFRWDILRQVGQGIVAYSSSGIMTLHSGFLRTPETAAWHSATAACFTLISFMSLRSRLFSGWKTAALVIFFALAVVLTGRRKAMAELVIFISIFGFFLAYFRKGAAKLSIIVLIIGIAGLIAINTVLDDGGRSAAFNPYFQRTISVKQDSFARLYNMTIGSFQWVLAQNGFFGAGAGAGSQGAQHFGTSTVGGAAEGGLGKVLAELGVPGLVLFVMISVRVIVYFKRIMLRGAKAGHAHNRLLYGLISLIVANGVVFATAHQVFGDPFVLLIMGWIVGFAFALSGAYSDATVPNPVEKT